MAGDLNYVLDPVLDRQTSIFRNSGTLNSLTIW